MSVSPTVVVGKAKELRALFGSWDAAGQRARLYVTVSAGCYRATWEAVVAYIYANHH